MLFGNIKPSQQLTTMTLLLMLLQADGHETISTCGQLAPESVIPLLANSYRTHHWPWHAALYHQLKEFYKMYVCGGTLITANSVLTAAHCVSLQDVPLYVKHVAISLGRLDLGTSESTEQSFEIAEIILHPDFNSADFVNDIAIIRLTVDATFNNYVRPICMWKSDKTDLSEVIDKLGIVVGWGLTGNNQASNVLQQVNLPVVDSWTCISSNRDIFTKFLSGRNFCAGFRNGTSVCSGDSGGSISFKENGIYYTRGVVSVGTSKKDPITGDTVCDPTQFALFTDVAHYLPWIVENSATECQTKVSCTWREANTCSVVISAAQSARKCEISFEETSNTTVRAISIDGESYDIPELSDGATKFSNLESLKLSRIKLQKVDKARLTAFKKIKELDFRDNEISKLQADAFAALLNLTDLYLHSNNLKVVDADLFKDLLKLEKISLSGNQLATVPATIFRFIEKLREVGLASNQLKEVHGDLFKHVRNLEVVNLQSNQLETIPSDLFHSNEKLREIYLGTNQLKEIHDNLFKYLVNLELVALEDNHLETIPENIFSYSNKLRRKNLAGNQLRTQ